MPQLISWESLDDFGGQALRNLQLGCAIYCGEIQHYPEVDIAMAQTQDAQCHRLFEIKVVRGDPIPGRAPPSALAAIVDISASPCYYPVTMNIRFVSADAKQMHAFGGSCLLTICGRARMFLT